MRKWTTSACVALAWSIMPLLAAADLAVPGHPAQATTTTSITQTVLAKAPGTPTANATSPAGGTMPNWLKDILIGAGLLAAIAFAIEPLAVFTRRRRHTDKTPRSHANTRERDSARDATARAKIVFTDHERLIVTYSSQDDTVYVFTPPGEDPRTVLRAARLILPEDRYQELADHLGIPSAMPLE